jgi:hypothetical protein
MKTDEQLKQMIHHIEKLRIYDDKTSIIVRNKMIDELNRQVMTIILNTDFIEVK